MAAKTVKLYPLDQSALFKCSSKKKLAMLLRCTQKELVFLAKNARELYHNFDIPKKNSTEKRGITAPHKELKKVQKRIFSLLRRVEKPDWVISSSLGKSYITNAKYHQQSDYFFKTDILHFYDNCKRDRVYRFYREKLKTSPDIAELLADLTTRIDIPTGCPTSQLIAYFAYSDMFHNLHSIAVQHDCKMSLFVDDIVISSNTPFSFNSLARQLEIEVRKFDHKLKKSKTRFYSGKKGAPVTGVIIKENRLHIPNSLRQDVIFSFISFKDSPPKVIDKRSLAGKVQAAKRIEPNHFNGIKSFIKQ